MMLPLLIIVPFAGGLLAWGLGRASDGVSRWIAAATMTLDLALVATMWAQGAQPPTAPTASLRWWAEFDAPWIPQLGIRLHFAADGLSLLLVTLTCLMGLLTVVAIWREPHARPGFFYFNILWTLGAIIGVFLAIDLFLLYLLWELMLAPTYLLFLGGGQRRSYAGLKFVIFSQAGGLLLLLAILGLYFSHGLGTGTYTFDYPALLGTRLAAPTALLLMLGFFAGFAVKLPAVPLHPWQPDAYAESPMAGTIILAALMSKTAGYGMLRFVLPLFPEAALSFAPIAMGLGVASILYGGFLAFAQSDLKRLVAYSSLSHMGFVLLGIFAWNALSVQGAVMQMVAHGISVGALFILVGSLHERTRTFQLSEMGGLWSALPRLSATLLLFALATLGLPGLGIFVGEFLVLLGTFRIGAGYAAAGAAGIVVSAIYALWMIQRTIQGPRSEARTMRDLTFREGAVLGVLAVAIVWLGLAPQPVIEAAGQSLQNLGLAAVGSQTSRPPVQLATVVSIEVSP